MTDIMRTLEDLKLLNALCHGTVLDDAIEILKQRIGYWIEYPDCLQYDGVYDDTFIVCSVCNHVFNIIDNCTEEFDYCPHCGSKMEDGVKDDA